MSQAFQIDAQSNAATVNIPTTTETAILTTNALPIPYQNGKAVIQGTLVLTPGTTTNLLTIRVRRNPNGENVIVLNAPLAAGFVVGAAGDISFGVTDVIPDNRSVSYQVTVQQGAATANGTAQIGCFMQAQVISG